MSESRRWPARLARRDLMILLLAFAGAGVDAVSFLGFGRVFVANQTGNTIILAVALAQGQVATELRAAVSLVGFILGTAVGEAIVAGSRDRALWPSAVGRALVVELIPLLGLFAGWRLAGSVPSGPVLDLLIVLSALSMGIQSAAVLRLGVGVSTTYITGTMAAFAAEAVRWLRIVETTPPTSPVRRELEPLSALSGRGPLLSGATWLTYAVGAVVSGVLFLRLGELTLLLPILAIVAVVIGEGMPSAG